jgi:hypothetical protein
VRWRRNEQGGGLWLLWVWLWLRCVVWLCGCV